MSTDKHVSNLLSHDEAQILLDFLRRLGQGLVRIHPLQGDGSARRFFRVFVKDGDTLVLICPQKGPWGLREAASYAKIGYFLRAQGLCVPKIWAYEEESGLILVEDLGDLRLQDLPPEQRAKFYPLVLKLLVDFQRAGQAFDPRICLETPFYDLELMWTKEALYFLEAFVQGYLGESPLPELEEELHSVCEKAVQTFTDTVLLHRDFQSRNIMLHKGWPYLIDFQGTRLGPPAYDVASLLLDPYVSLPLEERRSYLEQYLALTQREKEPFLREFAYLSLLRNLQILGAFAKLTALGKTWFSAYIPPALAHLRYLLDTYFPKLKALKTLLART